MNKVKNIIFDLGGVIINLREEKEWHSNFMLPLLGNKGLNDAINNKYFDDLELGNLLEDTFHEKLKECSGKEFTMKQLKIAWNSRLLNIPKNRIDLLYKLSKDFNLFLLSNTNSIHLDYILNDIVETYKTKIFDEVFIKCYYSQVLKMAKPAKEIYEAVLKESNLIASESLFIDDNEENLVAPNNIGIQTIHFHNDLQFQTELKALLEN